MEHSVVMENKNQSRVGLWTKMAVILVALLLADAFLAWYLQMRYGDLLFIEGMFVFAAGAYVAAGTGNLRRETVGTMMTDPEGQKGVS